MISSAFALKESNITPSYLVDNTETKLEEGYYLNTTLNFLLETHEELLSCRRNFYRTILESKDNPYIIEESFNDITTKIKEIIKKILAFIESLVKRFVTQIAKFFNSDKYIIKMKDSIAKFSNDDSFDFEGYEYTISNDVPIVDIVSLDLSGIKEELKTIGDKNIGDKLGKISEIIGKLSDEGKMDDFCGQIMNVEHPIPQSNFDNEIFAVFRDGSSEEHTIKADKEYVMKAMRDYEGYKDKIKSVKSTKNQIERKYRTLESQVDGIVTADMKIDGNSLINVKLGEEKYSTDYITKMKRQLDNLMELQVAQIQRIANLHTRALAAKLDAYNSLMVQDRKVLYKALNKVQKNINNSKLMEESSAHILCSEGSYDYTRDAQIKGYLLEKYFMDKRQERFIQECLALSESNLPELVSIQEDLKMDAKNKFQKLKDLLKSLWEKFLMKMNKFFTNNKEFLEKYKSIILTKKVDTYTLNDMPNYEAGIKNIVGVKLKVNLDVKNMISKSELEIQKELLPKYSGDGDFAEFAKEFFLCNNEPRQDKVEMTPEKQGLVMKDYYAFCINAQATINTLKADQTQLNSTLDKTRQVLLNSVQAKTESTDIYGNKYYYSSVLESYVTEEEENQGDAKTKPLDLNVPKDDKPSEKNDNSKDNTKPDDKDNTDNQTKDNNADKKKLEDTINWYFNGLKTVWAAKITAYQKIYSEYMKILRYHVQKATGSMGSTSKFTEDDAKEIKEQMKKWKDGDKEAKESAEQRIIDIYKSRKMVIDRHDVQNLVEKNMKNLG